MKTDGKIPAWVKDYVGISFEVCNCWQLMCLIYRDQLNIKLPYLDNRYVDAWDQNKISELYAAELARVWQPTETPAVFSAVVFKIQGNPWHVGCVIAKDTMLHTHYRINAAVERFNNALWRHRIEGFYNYVG